VNIHKKYYFSSQKGEHIFACPNNSKQAIKTEGVRMKGYTGRDMGISLPKFHYNLPF
jgi:hypothetical protein